MGLSPDPAKRANQLRNLSSGWPSAARRHGLAPPARPSGDPPETPDPEPELEPASGPSLEVMSYDAPAPPDPKPNPKPARKRRPTPAREPDPAPEPGLDPEEPRRGGVFGELRAGFFGGE